MHNTIKMKGKVDRIKVNDRTIEQNKPNTILNQGFNTLLSLSQTPYVTLNSPTSVPSLTILSQSGWLRPIKTAGNLFGGFPCIGCLFGKDDSATTVDMTSLVSPIGSTNNLDSFGFNRSDLDYQRSFVIYESSNDKTVHHMKYCWKATEDATIKEIGIYSFSMDSSMAATGYSRTDAQKLSYYTDRKMFSRCVLQTPVEVKTGDLVVVYYSIEVVPPYENGSLHEVSNVFGMPAVMAYMGEGNKLKIEIANRNYALGPISSTYEFSGFSSSMPSSVGDTLNILDVLNQCNYSSSALVSSSCAENMTTALQLGSKSSSHIFTNSNYISFTKSSAAYTGMPNRSASLDYARSISYGDGMQDYVFDYSIDKSTDIWTKKMHIEAKTWHKTNDLENMYWYLCYGPFLYYLNSALDESGRIVQTPFDMSKTAKFTFDISNTFVRE